MAVKGSNFVLVDTNRYPILVVCESGTIFFERQVSSKTITDLVEQISMMNVSDISVRYSAVVEEGITSSYIFIPKTHNPPQPSKRRYHYTPGRMRATTYFKQDLPEADHESYKRMCANVRLNGNYYSNSLIGGISSLVRYYGLDIFEQALDDLKVSRYNDE